MSDKNEDMTLGTWSESEVDMLEFMMAYAARAMTTDETLPEAYTKKVAAFMMDVAKRIEKVRNLRAYADVHR